MMHSEFWNDPTARNYGDIYARWSNKVSKQLFVSNQNLKQQFWVVASHFDVASSIMKWNCIPMGEEESDKEN